MNPAQLAFLVALVVTLAILLAWWWRNGPRDFNATARVYSPSPPCAQPVPAGTRGDKTHEIHRDAEALFYLACHGTPLSRRAASQHRAWSVRRWRRAYRFARKCGVFDKLQTPLMDYESGRDALMAEYERVTDLAGRGRYVTP